LGDDTPCKIVGMRKLKAKEWIVMVVERGKTYYIYKEKSNFNGIVGK
jgi:hypothetical protein